jgi:hypothetical protein
MSEIERALDILDKWEFFYGQRAGRELWSDKPVEVQNKDIADFSRDIALVRSQLREKAERDKGCEYCNSLISYKGHPYREDGEIIHFCKKCGRKLKGANEE